MLQAALALLALGEPLLFHAAPMQCYTNRHLRTLYRCCSDRVVLWTEMEKCSDLLGSAAAARRRLHHAVEKPNVLQLGGSDPAELARATKLGLDYGFEEINLNCGCPSIESGGGSFGASLMRDPEKARACVAAMRSTGARVSVKCRVGTREHIDDGDDDDAALYERLARWVEAVAAAGASHVVVHARVAVLAGASPAWNREAPPLKPRLVERLARDFPALRVTTNGGLASLDDVRAVRAPVRGAMAGRWLLQRPLDLCEVDAEPALGGGGGPGVSRAAAVRRYVRHAEREAALGTPAGELAMPLMLVHEQLKADGAESDELDALERGAEALVTDGRALSGSSPRALSKAIQSAMGKKVANKVRRNRREALRYWLR